jgi:hypothetical protein
VKVLSPVIFNVGEDDGFHISEVSILSVVMVRDIRFSRGLSPRDESEWKSQELGRPGIFPGRISADNPKRKGSGKELPGVGLTHSRGVAG